jgi:hypothetical protein
MNETLKRTAARLALRHLHKKLKAPDIPVKVVTKSSNHKTGPMAATYVAQGSCPVTCPFYDAGCYGLSGPSSLVFAALSQHGVGWSPEALAVMEADLINATPAVRDMRLHVVGDCRTPEAASTVARACEHYMERSGALRSKVFGFTHAADSVPRAAWGKVSVLASCESFAQVDTFTDAGYATAIVVAEFENGKKAWTETTPNREYTVVPCRFDTAGVQCVKCRLCMDDDKLRANNVVIAFRAHGTGRPSVVRALAVINGE